MSYDEKFVKISTLSLVSHFVKVKGAKFFGRKRGRRTMTLAGSEMADHNQNINKLCLVQQYFNKMECYYSNSLKIWKSLNLKALALWNSCMPKGCGTEEMQHLTIYTTKHEIRLRKYVRKLCL